MKKRFYLSLVIFGLVGQIAWVVENMYLNVFIHEMFGASPAQISLMVSASAVAATLTTVLMGALSDKVGKRRAFISGGYILWGISILAFALVRTDLIGGLFPMAASVYTVCIGLVIFLDCLMTFFGSTANDACFNAWLTDMTEEGERGRAEGINSVMPLIALLAVFGGFMSFDLSLAKSWTVIFCIIGGVVLLMGILGLFLIPEPALRVEANRNYFANIIYGFRPSVVRENKKMYLSLGGFALFGISIQIFMPYLILYYTDALRMDNYVLIMAPAILLAAIFTVLWGRVYDRLGFGRSVLPSLVLLGAGYLILYFCRSTAPVFVGSLLMMCGYLSGAASFGAIIRDHTPENRSGMFQGLRIVAQVLIPGVIGPSIGAWILRDAETVLGQDGVETFIPNASIFLGALVALLALALYLLLVLRRGKKAG
ncbi:MAG: MFS transporter [Clostridia bacterium]|nr:MFS transporter [Clostridia bacterium]